MNPTAIALVIVGLMLAPPARAQAVSKGPAPGPTATAPVPRTAFIQTMDGEFGKMDADKNKTLTRSEIEQFQRAVAMVAAQERARALFSQLDADRNGQLSLPEFGKMATSPPPPNPMAVLGEVDLNRDGMVTLVEFRTAKLSKFDRMDADKDGIVSVQEMKAAGLVK